MVAGSNMPALNLSDTLSETTNKLNIIPVTEKFAWPGSIGEVGADNDLLDKLKLGNCILHNIDFGTSGIASDAEYGNGKIGDYTKHCKFSGSGGDKDNSNSSSGGNTGGGSSGGEATSTPTIPPIASSTHAPAPTFEVEPSEPAPPASAFDKLGWWLENDGWHYYYILNVDVRNDWRKIDGYWYAFRPDGVRREGWFDDTQYPGRYYLGNDGRMRIGWQQIADPATGRLQWYWFGASGRMASYHYNSIRDKYTWHEFDVEGRWIAERNKAGWVQYPKGWAFRLQSNSWLTNSLVRISGVWYYFDNNGYMKTGNITVDGRQYKMAQDGAPMTGWVKYDKGWAFLNDSAGKQEWVHGWIRINNKWHWLDGAGYAVDGWQQISGTWYYFDNTEMVTGTHSIGGKTYKFAASGAWQS